jgi:hypothetical protein
MRHFQLRHGRRRKAIPSGLVKWFCAIAANPPLKQQRLQSGKRSKALAGKTVTTVLIFSGSCAAYKIASLVGLDFVAAAATH